MSALNISLPRFDYMCQNNTFSGSQGRFRYKFFPEKKDDIDTVLVAACYLDLEAGRITRQEFPYSDEGIDLAEAWLAAQYDEQEK